MAASVRQERGLPLRPTQYIYPDLKCDIEEDGVICGEPVRNKLRMLCQKHYARWQRNGHTGVSVNHTAKKRKMARREAQEKVRREHDMSLWCLCSHAFKQHSANNNCLIQGCECIEFESTSEVTLHLVLAKMRKLGFLYPLNNKARCQYCAELIPVGYWYDPHVLIRIREHLRMKHVVRRISRAG